MKNKFLIIFLLTIISSAWLRAQKYEEPQWQMPLYFEDATGAKDTVWLGYDPSAGIYGVDIDPQFGEEWMWIDTSQFNVYFFDRFIPEPYAHYEDTVLKRDISSWHLIIGSQLHFTHGQLPVTIKWEEDLLNSPNLPAFYPDISPRPKARIDLIFGMLPFEMNCQLMIDGAPDVILTSYIIHFSTCDCVLTDSAVIYGSEEPYYDEIGEVVGMVEIFGIAPHDYSYFANVTEDREAGFLIYPNPVSDILKIENLNCKNIELSIYDMQGKLVLQQNYTDNIIPIDFTTFNKGIYIIKIINNNKINTYKINKI